MALASYGVVCQREQLLIGVLPVSVCAQGHTVLDLYTTGHNEQQTHAEVCADMLQLMVAELGSARAFTQVPVKGAAAAASLTIYQGCCFRTCEKTNAHILVEYEALPRIISTRRGPGRDAHSHALGGAVSVRDVLAAGAHDADVGLLPARSRRAGPRPNVVSATI